MTKGRLALRTRFPAVESASESARPILIGQAPGPGSDPDLPLYPYPSRSAGGRLAELLGMTRGEYLRSFDRVNLLYEFPGRASGGDRFPMRDARVAARAITPFLRGRIVVFVGRNVARAFGFGGEVASFFDWHFAPVDGYAFAIVPHPSGRNRWFNDDGRILIFKEFSRTLTSRSAPSIVSKGELPTPS